MDNQSKNPVHHDLTEDIDETGHLALALFTGVIVVLLVVIYALAQAA